MCPLKSLRARRLKIWWGNLEAECTGYILVVRGRLWAKRAPCKDLEVGWHYLFLHLRKPTFSRTGDWKGRGSDLNELHNQFRR